MSEETNTVLNQDPKRMWHLLSLDELFERSSNKIVLNDYDFSKANYSQTLLDHVCSDKGEIDFIAKCKCEHYVGDFYVGAKCPICHTVVTDGMNIVEHFNEHKVWITLPEQIKGALSPIAFFILRSFLGYGKRGTSNYITEDLEIANKGEEKKGNYLEDILDVTTPPNPLISASIPGKGFNYFYDNFDYIMNYFLTMDKKTSKKSRAPSIQAWIKKYRNVLFCRHFPILSDVLHAAVSSDSTKENKRKYVDKYCQLILHAATSLSALKFKSKKRRGEKEVEKVTFSAYQHIIGYNAVVAKVHLSKKKSLPRMHLFGSRLHLSFRSVISPITGPHCIDELYVPFNVMVNTFRCELIGRLESHYGLTYLEAYDKQQSALTRFDEDIYDILCAFIVESKYKGIPVLWVRNPVVRIGGVEVMFITKVKTDMEDETISMSSLACKFSNADFDGDEKNGFRIPENELVDKFMALHASELYLSQNELSVTNLITIPKITQINVNRFLGRV